MPLLSQPYKAIQRFIFLLPPGETGVNSRARSKAAAYKMYDQTAVRRFKLYLCIQQLGTYRLLVFKAGDG